MSNFDNWKDPKKREKIYKWARYYYNKENKKETYLPPVKKTIWQNNIFLILRYPILYYKWKNNVKSILRENPKNTVITFWGFIESRRMDKLAREYRIKKK